MTDQNSTTDGRTMPEREEAFDREVNNSLKRNFLALLGHGMFGMTGFRLLQAPTFLPAYLFLLSGSDVLVGVALAAQHIGSGIASIPGANLISHRTRVLPLFFTIGALMRLQVLGIALAGFFFSDNMALWATCSFLGLFGLFNGAQMVMFQYTLSKLIPVRVRGKLTGFRNFVSGVIAAGVAMIGGTYFIDNNILGNGYSTTFLLAFILTVTGLLMLLGIREPEPPRMRAQSSLLKHAKEIPSMLRTYASFTRFVLVRSVAALGMAAVPFYILYAGEMRILTGTDLSVLTVCFLLAQTGSNFLWGAIADKQGNRLVFMASIGVWVTSAILLLNTPNEMLWLSIAFGGLGIGLGGYMIGAMNLILEMGDRENLPMLLGISTAVNSLFFAMGPILGGLTAQYLGYQELIIGSTVLLAIALTLTAFLVQEPRRAN